MKGLWKRQGDTVKLHMTLINTKHGVDEESGEGILQARKPIDARQIMNDFKDYHFGEQDVNEIHLSRCHTISKNGYYEANEVIYAK